MNSTTRSLLLAGAGLLAAASTADARHGGRGRASLRAGRGAVPGARGIVQVPTTQLRVLERAGARAEIAQRVASLASSIRGNVTPPFELINLSPTATLTEVRGSHYKNGITAQLRASGLGRGGSLDVTALLPVSGHLGAAKAADYAASNVYEVEVQYADGTRTNAVVPTTGYVTEHKLALVLRPGINFVRFYARGSSVGGFQSGREIEIDYDGT